MEPIARDDDPKDTTPVLQWLHNVPSSTRDEDGSRCESPSTPPTRPPVEDLTPIDSSVASNSIFGQSTSATINARFSSPATSLADDDESRPDSTPCKPRRATAAAIDVDDSRSFQRCSETCASSNDSPCDSTANGSEVDGDEEQAKGHHHNLNERPVVKEHEKLKIVWVTSCLNCTLANLPCCRNLPSCSRCVRNGRLCLPQRRMFACEYTRGGATGNRLPVLLRLSEDDAETWEKKVALTWKLLSAWLVEQDKKNWVLPLTTSYRSGFPRYTWSKESPRHPGQGLGVVTYHALETIWETE